MNTVQVALGLALGAAAVTPALGADLAAAKQTAAKCQACHGLDGLSRQPNAPNIAGQPAMYLEAQLRAYRSGDRSDPQMSVIAKNLSDEDISQVVAWYAAIELDVRAPKKIK